MRPLWTSWRMPYILALKTSTACVFCEEIFGTPNEENLVLHRGRRAFVVLNLYPYTTGHLMVVPYRHVAALIDLSPEETEEVTTLLQRAERAVAAELGARVQHVGLNLGRCAGAGVDGHLHVHLVPHGADLRPVPPDPAPQEPPEALAATRKRLLRAWLEQGREEGPHSSAS